MRGIWYGNACHRCGEGFLSRDRQQRLCGPCIAILGARGRRASLRGRWIPAPSPRPTAQPREEGAS
jgi:hypothetical protein